MKRSCLLRVELLEDRSVPAVDLATAVLPAAPIVPPQSFVIDPPLIDPNAPPPPQAPPPPSSSPPLPTDLIPPIVNPFWY